jgi:hypothetical protein
MKSGRAKLYLFLVTGILLTGITTPANTTTPDRPAVPGLAHGLSHSDVLRPPEVRLRKLHLVRPDLIPYPIEYEVVC